MLELLTVAEVAAILRVGPRQVQRLIARDGLPAIEGIRRGQLVLRDELDAWLHARSQHHGDGASDGGSRPAGVAVVAPTGGAAGDLGDLEEPAGGPRGGRE